MRVIAGKYGRRPLKAIKGDTTRPTADKIKESLFNILPPMTSFECALDFYGGTGALAIEAVSRGCQMAIICEKNKQAIQIIEENLRMTKEEERFTLLKGENHSQLKKWQQNNPDKKFDLFFLDPPYQLDHYIKDITLLTELNLLSEKCLIVCESSNEKMLPDNIAEFELKKVKKYGQTKLWFYE